VRGKNYNAGLRGVLFEARHYARMGQAVWLYGWLVLRETRERAGVGFVLGGRPVTYHEIEEETGFSRKSLERWMQVLRRGGYIETTTAPGGVIVRIQKAKKFSRDNSPGSSERFQQASKESEGKLWKSPEDVRPLLRFADPPPQFEEPPPQICGVMHTENEESAELARGIGSGAIERQVEKQNEIPFSSLKQETTSREGSNSQESCFATKKSETDACRTSHDLPAGRSSGTHNTARPIPFSYGSRQRLRDEEISRELRVGAGPEVRR
jgi:hypothetical protein